MAVALVEADDLLVEVNRLAELLLLLDELLDEILRQHLREPRHVEDEFFRIQRHQLAARLRQCVDDLRADAAHSRVEKTEQAGRTGSDDRDVLLFVNHLGKIGTFSA